MASFRFLHTADIHLDSPLRGLARQEGSAAERVRSATREALDQFVELAIREDVDFVVIAGDLYDGDWRDYNTGLFFARQMGRLNEAGIRAYLLYGNHDAESQITKQLELPANVHVFSARKPQTFKIEDLDGVALHGLGYSQREVKDNLVRDYPKPLSGAFFNIGVLHTGLGVGGDDHANYAPCSLEDLRNKGYDYWALGHVHKAQVLNKHPHVVFPGNLQGRHAKETGAKGAYLVTVEDNEVSGLEFVHCDTVRWVVLPVRLDNVDSRNDVTDRIRKAIESAVATESDERLLACRVVLEGRTELHNRIVASEEDILAEARSIALGLGDEVAWVEKIVVSTEATVDEQTLAKREDAVGELLRLLQDAKSDENILKQIEDDIGALVRQLPYEVCSEPEDSLLRSAVEGEYGKLITGVIPYLSAHLNPRRETT